ANLADSVKIEGEKFGVIAGPSLMEAARAGPFEVANHIAVRIQYADFGDRDERQLLLPARLPQHGFGPEHRQRLVLFTVQDPPRPVRGLSFCAHEAPVRLSHVADSTGRPAAFHSG